MLFSQPLSLDGICASVWKAEWLKDNNKHHGWQVIVWWKVYWKPSVQGSALELWRYTFAPGQLENLTLFIEIIYWAPWISQVENTGLPSIFLRAQFCSRNIKTNAVKHFNNTKRCPSYREYSYSKMTAKQQGPLLGVHLGEVSAKRELTVCPPMTTTVYCFVTHFL